MSTTEQHLKTQTARSRWSASRTPAESTHGMVVAKNSVAVEAGLAMLAQGGNAIDAAVATAFAVGVAEPWMNGLGGGGFMIVWLAAEQRSLAIEFPMMSAAACRPEMFQLTGSVDSALFGWPSVVDNANVLGQTSVCVPGTVAGLTLALEKYGTLPLPTVMAPAIELAEVGVAVTWHTTLTMAKSLGDLQSFPETARVFLDAKGNPLVSVEQANPTLLRQPDLAHTLRAIAAGGSRAFYEGEIAEKMVSHLEANGSLLTLDDFASHRALDAETVTVDYRDHRLHTVGKGSGGTSLAQAFQMLSQVDLGAKGHNSPEAIHLLTQAFRQAYADRFTYLADPDTNEVPLDALLSTDYANERVARFQHDGLAPIQPGSKARLGVQHNLEGSVPEFMQDGSTTHLGAIDAAGNAVSLTQTLLSGWGSRVVAPGTGVLLNNGMMWFDPEPGRPNSVGGRKRPLTNMAPVLVTKDDRIVASIGSSGGRKITCCNAELIVNLVDYGFGMDEALASPRFDASTRKLIVSDRIPAETLERLRQLGHTVELRDESLLTGDFASPAAIARGEDGKLVGAADAWYFPAAAGGVTTGNQE
ncbi:MAG: gamma-glutamyltransferase [Thermomicrobiales bacterium]